MEDIKKLDRQLFVGELISPSRLILSGFFGFVPALLVYFAPFFEVKMIFGSVLLIIAIIHWRSASAAAVKKRFRNGAFESLWRACQHRYRLFEEVVSKVKRDQIADFQEMPGTIKRVAESLYVALRRADLISSEVMETERGIYSQSTMWVPQIADKRTTELYKMADRNIAEYRQSFAGVMAGVKRTEAQAAVFQTTLDTIRMRMIGHRLIGKSPELANDDFLFSLHEAKLQLLAIDKALEELEFISIPPGVEMSLGQTPPAVDPSTISSGMPHL